MKTKSDYLSEVLWLLHQILKQSGPMTEEWRIRIAKWRKEVIDQYPDVDKDMIPDK